MAVNKKIFIIAFIITVLILVSILLSNSILNDKREQVLMERMDLMVEEYEDMQALLFMSDFFGEEATCLALETAYVTGKFPMKRLLSESEFKAYA